MKNVVIALVSCLGVLINAGFVDAASPQNSSPTPAEELSAKLQKVQTFQAEFEQKIVAPDGDVLQSVVGKVVVKKPGLFFWEVAPPYEQIVVANHKNLWVYDPDLEQVTRSDRNTLDNTPAQILSGDFSSLGDKYRVTVKSTKVASVYSLVAHDTKASSFAAIDFEFDKKDILQSMVLVDKLDQKTFVQLSKQQVNAKVADSIFDFVAPKGTDIIEN